MVIDRPESPADLGEFVEAGRIVPAGNGWRWYQHGWRLFRAQMGLWIGVGLMFFLLTTVIQIIPILGFIASFFMAPLLIGGLMVGCHTIDCGGRMQFGDLFAGFSRSMGPLLILGLLEIAGLITIGLITLAIMGASLAMPDFDALGLRFLFALLVGLVLIAAYLSAVWFAPALIVLNNLSAWAAIQAGFKASLRNWRSFTVFGLAGLLIAIPVVLIFSAMAGGLAASAIVGSGAGISSMIWGVLFVMVPLMIVCFAALAPIVFGSIYASYRDIFYRAG